MRINQAIGHLRLKDITPLHIQAFYRNLQEEGVRQKVTAQATPALAAWQQGQKLSQAELARRAGVSRPTVGQALKGRPVSLDSAQKLAAVAGQPVGVLFQVQPNTSPLSAATIHAYHRVLSSILKRAVRWRCIPANPAEGAELPSLAGHSAHYLDEPDARRMLQLLLSEPIKWAAPVIFDLLSGLRGVENGGGAVLALFLAAEEEIPRSRKIALDGMGHLGAVFLPRRIEFCRDGRALCNEHGLRALVIT